MNNFVFHNGVKIIFGKGVVINLGSEVEKVTRKVLLVYGGGSVKKNGSYNDVVSSLREHRIEYVELSGVKPNPRIDSVREGARLCKENNLGAVIALGGGSVIDCSKIIAAGAVYDKDPWNFLIGKDGIEAALPIFAILTLSATGSEMNSGAVISDMATNDKMDCASAFTFPRVSFLDPTYTYSVDKLQTAAGTADIMSHVMEQYFGDFNGSYLQDRLAEGILKTCIHYCPIALSNPEDYEARANLMWSSSIALNGLLSAGHGYPWVVHPIEHQISGYYDVTHGAGLAVLTPAYFRYILDESNAARFALFAHNVFGVKQKGRTEIDIAKEGINDLEKFFLSIGLPGHMKDLGVKNDKFEEMATKAWTRNHLDQTFGKLSIEDIVEIYKSCF